MKRVLIVSTSTIHGSDYLEYILPEVKKFFGENKKIVFIPYARPGGISHDDYTELAAKKFKTIGIEVIGIHTSTNKEQLIDDADGIFTGGGNTFLLVKQLHELGLMKLIKTKVSEGKAYMGTSAGCNITGQNMKTTNDMPIVLPPSFETLGLVPFNLNPHYLDPDPNSKHKGETRETRIKEFHTQNNTPVVGLREGSWLEVNNEEVILHGKLKAIVFEAKKAPYELETGSLIKF